MEEVDEEGEEEDVVEVEVVLKVEFAVIVTMGPPPVVELVIVEVIEVVEAITQLIM